MQKIKKFEWKVIGISSMDDFIITKDQIDEMFLHYLKLRLKIRGVNHGSYDEAWYCGQAQECEKWLNMLGIDTSYDVVEPLLDEKESRLIKC